MRFHFPAFLFMPLLILFGAGPLQAQAPGGKSLRELGETVYAREITKIRAWYGPKMKDLEVRAAAAGTAELAGRIRKKWQETDPAAAAASPAPAVARTDPPPAASAGASPTGTAHAKEEKSAEASAKADAKPDDKLRHIEGDWKDVEHEYGKRALLLAEACYKNGLIGRAYDLMFEILHHDPDQSAARANLGQEKTKDGWIPHYEARLLATGFVNHAEFGWVPKKDLPNYEKGQLPLNGKWVPAAEAAAAHQPWPAAWKIETEHYMIVSNLGYQSAVAIARAAERLYRVFFRIFIGFFEQKQQAGVLFKYEEKPAARKHKVFFFRDQKGYVDEINAAHSKEAVGGADPRQRPGYYTTSDQTAHFWAGDRGVDYRTFYHEGTHQLFYESRATALGKQDGAGCWVVEGGAAYMETVREGPTGEPGAGDPKDARNLQALRAIQAGKAEPLAKFLRMDVKAFQSGEVSDHYAQAASMVWFFMDADHGKYREDFVRYMTDIYMGQGGTADLPKRLGTTPEKLDEEWKAFMKGTAGR